MTDRSGEFSRCNGYIIVGLLVGLAIGIGVGPQVQGFMITNGWPNETTRWISISMIFVSIILNGFLYYGLKKGDHGKPIRSPSPQSER